MIGWIQKSRAAGRWFPQTPKDKKEPEPHYSGGMALNPSQPEIIYLSRQINDIFEIEKWITPNFGRTWRSMAITTDSDNPNVRPVVPRYCPPNSNIVLWMNGSYIHYTNYHTGIKISPGK